MKKILSISLLIVATLITFNVSAQDAKAKAVIDKLHEKYFNLQSLKMSILLETKDNKGKVSKKSGNISIKGDKYYANLGTEMVMSDGKTSYLYMKSYNEVQVSNVDANSKDFLSIFISMDKQFLAKYNITYVGAKKFNGFSTEAVQLTPKSSTSFSKMILYVNSSNYLLAGAEIYDKSGGVMIFKTSNIQTNVTISDATFKFDTKKYPGVEVIDLR